MCQVLCEMPDKKARIKCHFILLEPTVSWGGEWGQRAQPVFSIPKVGVLLENHSAQQVLCEGQQASPKESESLGGLAG